jgi:hypothetical protein
MINGNLASPSRSESVSSIHGVGHDAQADRWNRGACTEKEEQKLEGMSSFASNAH